MRKFLLLALIIVLGGCSESKSNGSDVLSQEECECRGGEYTIKETNVVLSGRIGIPVDSYSCFKDGEEIFRVFRNETCEKYWELKNN